MFDNRSDEEMAAFRLRLDEQHKALKAEVSEYRDKLQAMTTEEFIAELHDINWSRPGQPGLGSIGGTAFDEVIRRLEDCYD